MILLQEQQTMAQSGSVQIVLEITQDSVRKGKRNTVLKVKALQNAEITRSCSVPMGLITTVINELCIHFSRYYTIFKIGCCCGPCNSIMHCKKQNLWIFQKFLDLELDIWMIHYVAHGCLRNRQLLNKDYWLYTPYHVFVRINVLVLFHYGAVPRKWIKWNDLKIKMMVWMENWQSAKTESGVYTNVVRKHHVTPCGRRCVQRAELGRDFGVCLLRKGFEKIRFQTYSTFAVVC